MYTLLINSKHDYLQVLLIMKLESFILVSNNHIFYNVLKFENPNMITLLNFYELQSSFKSISSMR